MLYFYKGLGHSLYERGSLGISKREKRNFQNGFDFASYFIRVRITALGDASAVALDAGPSFVHYLWSVPLFAVGRSWAFLLR